MSATQKAVLITTDNQNYLATRFDIDEEYIRELLGFYIVCDFGYDEDYSFLSKAALNKLFEEVPEDERTSKEMLNGFFEIRRKV